jgi:hypothetical protein
VPPQATITLPARTSAIRLQPFLTCPDLQNVTLKQLGQDGDGAEAVTRKIVKAVQQVLPRAPGCRAHSHLDAMQSLIINAAAELGIGKVGVVCGCVRGLPHALSCQLVASALAHVQGAGRGGSASAGGGGQDAAADVKLRGDDVNLNHLCVHIFRRRANRCSPGVPSHAPATPHPKHDMATRPHFACSHLLPMSDAELAKYKSLMEEDFRKNQLKPGDEGYEYDKQVQGGALRSRALHVTPAAG